MKGQEVGPVKCTPADLPGFLLPLRPLERIPSGTRLVIDFHKVVSVLNIPPRNFCQEIVTSVRIRRGYCQPCYGFNPILYC